MNPTMLTIFGLEIKWYSFLILTGIFIGMYLVLKEAKKFNISKDDIKYVFLWHSFWYFRCKIILCII